MALRGGFMNKHYSEVLGGHIRDLRKEKRLTLTQLGKLAHIPTSTLCCYEKGARRVEAINFFKICRALNVSPEDIQKYMEDYIATH